MPLMQKSSADKSLNKTSLADAIDIPAWLEQDRQNEWQSRIQRDQQIAQQISRQAKIAPQQETKQVLHWWSQIRCQEVEPQCQKDVDANSSGHLLASIFKRVSWIAWIIGFIAGIVLAASLLHYDGAQPINVLVLLIILVLLPLLLFLLSLLIPLFSSSSLMSSLNVGNQLFAFIRRNSPVLQNFFSSSRSDSSKDALLRWKLLLSSQQFGIALAVAALLTLLAKVSFSDLAFGWSTTLDIQSSSLTPWIHALATPWASWFPEAVPSSQLIEQSRFYRLEDGVRALSAEALTGWWKYIAMCLLVYGIGFRILAAWLANVKYKTATENMLMQHSEVTALLERFNASAKLHDIAPVVTVNDVSINDSSGFDYESVDIVILWNRANLFKNNLQHKNIVELTSEDALQLDSSHFSGLDKNSVEKIHIITKAWEPPLLEFHDLIINLREKFGSHVIISVEPVAADKSTPEKVDVEIWRHSLEKLQDTKVYVI